MCKIEKLSTELKLKDSLFVPCEEVREKTLKELNKKINPKCDLFTLHYPENQEKPFFTPYYCLYDEKELE